MADAIRKFFRGRRTFVAAAVAAAAAIGIFLCTALTARGIGCLPDLGAVREEREYRELELAYRADVRGLLEEAGYRNAGVTLTHTVDGDGNRAYLVRIYHARLGRLSEERREELLTAVEALGFADGQSSFRAQFL